MATLPPILTPQPLPSQAEAIRAFIIAAFAVVTVAPSPALLAAVNAAIHALLAGSGSAATLAAVIMGSGATGIPPVSQG